MRSLAAALGLTLLSASTLLSQQRAVPRPTPGQGRAIPRTESAVPYKVGETLNYDVSWSSFIVAGTATASVREKRPSNDSTAYYVVVEGKPVPLVARLYPLYYKMESLIDSYDLLSQRGSLYAEEGGDRRTSTTRFDRAGRRAMFEQKTDTTLTANLTIPPQTQDGLAAFYSLRTRTFKSGDRLTIPVADSGALYTAQVSVGGVETVAVPFGRTPAWKLQLDITDSDNQPVWKNVAVWMSNDARRLPIKLQAELPVGSFVLALRDAR
jgi:hypothetical protein